MPRQREINTPAARTNEAAVEHDEPVIIETVQLEGIEEPTLINIKEQLQKEREEHEKTKAELELINERINHRKPID